MVYSSIGYTLADNVENLVLTGAGNDTGTGNALGNRLDGSQSSGANQLVGGAGDDTYVLGAGDTAVEIAGEGNDTVIVATSFALAGAAVENISLAGSANIDATGNAFDNVLSGNAGNNRLVGEAGNDAYRFGRGDGQDAVLDADATGGNLDKIVFGTGVAVADVRLSRDGNHLVAAIAGTTDRIVVEEQFGAAGWGVEEIRFEIRRRSGRPPTSTGWSTTRRRRWPIRWPTRLPAKVRRSASPFQRTPSAIPTPAIS
ncbi:MAG: hypothetical protein IPJ52_00890 [Rhodocyclaceae bacterium]|nr:hypothetical protein [Rhodocyclaceae bacterium]